jgi:hypothetical protein
MRTIPILALMLCAMPAAPAVVTCQVWESPIACQNHANQEAANERAYREAVAKKAEMNQELAAARARFWATYPDKPGFEAARVKFVELLHEKDMYYMILFCSSDGFRKMVPGAPIGGEPVTVRPIK